MYIIDVRASHYKINPLLCIICTDCDRLYRQIDRQTERQTDRQTDRQSDRRDFFLPFSIKRNCVKIPGKF